MPGFELIGKEEQKAVNDVFEIGNGVLYRRGFDNSTTEELQYLTPIVGVNYKKFMASYTYTKQSGDILFEDAGYHQITLGFNFGCREPRRSGCPNINGSF